MFLKKIKLDGFKSFAKPLVVRFDSPLTAIVGPNGSGKSNIVDAIRWALGEQSARTLRGNRMADVIFSGSEQLKPLHKASVTLYLDNRSQLLPLDTGEVSICRQVDESGQSEYLLNGTSCRLKDIEEILAGTGMGKDSYSVVGQGQIDSILNSRPEKIRELFEEAAGITKYKQRKHEAERRMEKTEHDLERIGDLIWELKKQARPLKTAAEKDRKYRRLKGELSRLEVSYLLDRWEQNRGEAERLSEERDHLSGKYSRIEDELAGVEENLQSAREGLRLEKKLLEDLKESFYQLRGKKEEAENKLKILAERVSHLEAEQHREDKRFLELETGREELEKKQEKLEGEYREIEELTEQTSRKLQAAEDLLEKKKAALLKKEERLQSLMELEYELDKIQGKGLLLEEENQKIDKKQAGLEAENRMVIEAVRESSAEQKALEREIEKTSCLLEELGDEEQKIREELEGHKEDLTGLSEGLNRTRTQQQMLLDMEEEYRGYYPGVRAILKEAEQIPGIIGVVADLFTVDEKYELAVATALGANLQNIIVEDDRSARTGIEFLKKGKRGRATFLPLNMIQGRKARLDQDIHEGLLGLAVDFISYEEMLEPAVNYLLGDILVARNLDDAVAITRKLKRGLKIVTLAGEFINSGGAITGGSSHNNRGSLLGRSRQIDELAEKSRVFERRLAQKRERVEESETNFKEVLAAREEYKEQLHRLELELNKWREIKVGQHREQGRLEREISELKQESLLLKEKLLENSSRREGIENSLENDPEHPGSSGESLKELEREKEEINSRLVELKIDQATLKQREENIEMQRGSLFRKIAEIADETAENRKNIKELKIEVADLKDRKERLLKMKDDFTEEAVILEEVLEEKRQLLDQLENENSDLEKEAGEKRSLYNKLKDELYGVELKLTRLEDRNEQLVERLREEYQLEPESAGVDRIDINYSGVRKKIRELKSAIDKLGVVNQGAIEEYAGLNSRLENLLKQNDDLTDARDSIRGVIKELEVRMSNKFAETFGRVKEEFAGIFQRLFEGGQAQLELTSPDELLETGVEIIAQPPGKKLKRLTLMSGGEKALTATALVFALLQVSPSPLYILDEIDAPLDDANVQRFSRFLREYSQDVQFILITHNKNMMVETDAIYGITMEESGISKLISLRLDRGIA